MEQIIEKLSEDTYIPIHGYIVDGQVVLQDKYGTQLPYEIVDYIRDDETDIEHYLLERKKNFLSMQGIEPTEKNLEKIGGLDV